MISFSTQAKTNAGTAVDLDGELQKWHTITLTFDGPETSEIAEDNPFVNYRLNVEFTHKKTGQQFLVPGYFAADGKSHNTGAISGNKWRVHFSPNEVGDWTWHASFRKGRFVAVSNLPLTGLTGEFMDNQKGKFHITPSTKKYPDFRARGRLEYINQPYLRLAESGEYFIKSGPDSPENLLAYIDFDGSFHNDKHNDDSIKTWKDHEKDWQKGDPSWQKGKGKGLIGAFNYLSAQGLNSVSFLTMNILGDDKNVFPYVDYTTYDRFDVSKLAQWEIAFEHAQSKGLFLHFKTQEVENQGLLDNGGLGLERKLYYRELIARFSHHLALNWNMGEENGEWSSWKATVPQTTNQRLSMAQYFHDHDPYKHHIVIHNGNFFHDLTGANSFYTGASLQTSQEDYSGVHSEVKQIRNWPVANGKPLAVSVDEPGHHKYNLPPDHIDPEHTLTRMNALWGALTAGAWGVEWYFGYGAPESDLSAQSWRSRELFWQQVKHALDFFKIIDVPYHQATNLDNVIVDSVDEKSGDKDASTPTWVLGVEEQFYIVYAQSLNKDIQLNLPMGKTDYSIQWYDPRQGGKLISGTIETIHIDEVKKEYWDKASRSIGKPPNNFDKDWVILLKRL
ncbi:DUF5060 domain-containing protein [Colwellia sp. E2M01]|uniref:DUF5060 domain-containing protein n=1 Tax=Colwellia sp. E2M01 TaxID=2841561 RepID=UPI0020909A90|nr:DUF5060 domain-containing protein [Colwellia sp. E2M01]